MRKIKAIQHSSCTSYCGKTATHAFVNRGNPKVLPVRYCYDCALETQKENVWNERKWELVELQFSPPTKTAFLHGKKPGEKTKEGEKQK